MEVVRPFEPSSTVVHPCTTVEGEFCACTKHRCCMEPLPSLAALVAQSPLFCGIYLIGLLRFPFFHNKLCEILIKNFAHIDNSKLNYQYVSSICINSARTLASRSNSRVIVRS